MNNKILELVILEFKLQIDKLVDLFEIVDLYNFHYCYERNQF